MKSNRLSMLKQRALRGPFSPAIDPELERDLRSHYAIALEEKWYREVDARVAARVARATASSRLSMPERGVATGWKHGLARHAAAVVCAGAAAVAVGGVLNIGREAPHTYVPPTNSPSVHQPARTAGPTQFSMSRPGSSRNMASLL